MYKVLDTKTNCVMAMKTVKVENDEEGIPGTTIREISLLRELNSEHVVKLYRVIPTTGRIHMLFEYCELDMRKLMNSMKVSEALARDLVLQVIEGTSYCHCHRVMHRDIKPQNVFINFVDGRPVCKLGDFGLARSFGVPIRNYTHEVITLWYRPPEILLGTKLYSTSADVWSIGCLMAELIIGVPLFQGRSEVEMLFEIFNLRGTPTEQTWPGVTLLKDYKLTFPHFKGYSLRERLKAGRLSDAGYDLLEKLLQMNPTDRILLSDAMKHPWFSEK